MAAGVKGVTLLGDQVVGAAAITEDQKFDYHRKRLRKAYLSY